MAIPLGDGYYDSTSIRRAFDYQRSLSHSDVTRAADPLAAATLTYLFI